MVKIKDFFFHYLIYFIIGFLVLCFCLFLLLKGTSKPVLASTKIEISVENNVPESFYVDIKGAVNKPGVYEMNDGSIVNDLIKLAGGLKKTATTDNLNLSKKLTKEMVIKVFTKTELSKAIECNCDTKTVIETTTPEIVPVVENNDNCISTNKVNINTASINDLQLIEGIGESKAQKIIEYRNLNGLFNSIEDIMQVSGIGETVFAKIKESITV